MCPQKGVFEVVFETVTRKKRSTAQRFSGTKTVTHCGVLFGRCRCFLGDGSSCHSLDNRVLSAQGEEW